jgi:hypothetical protein|eukprot:COSAG01_NODE_2471_length_7630_cov_3.056566_18_plen_46_part_00
MIDRDASLGVTHAIYAPQVGYFMIRTDAVTEIPLQFCALHLRFLS